MFAGAGLSAVGLILEIVSFGNLDSFKQAIHKAQPALTTSQVNSFVTATIVASVIVSLISIGLWIWMAVASRAGKNWARIVSSIIFGVDTLWLLLIISRAGFQLGSIFNILIWLAGLGAIILLWRKDSSDYFQPGVPR
jgi:hypothetical protein